MFEEWFTPTWGDLAMVILASALVYASVIAFTRISGLRSFAKASAFDTAMTIAVGSLMASTLVSPNPPVLQGIVGIAMLFVWQALVAYLRLASSRSARVIDNEPLLLMRTGEFLEDNLKAANYSERDLWAHLRLAGVLDPGDVRAAVLETTGDVSILSSGDPAAALDERLLTGVSRG